MLVDTFMIGNAPMRAAYTNAAKRTPSSAGHADLARAAMTIAPGSEDARLLIDVPCDKPEAAGSTGGPLQQHRQVVWSQRWVHEAAAALALWL